MASVREGGKLLICGNGGSAGDAQHLAAEFVSTLTVDRRRGAIPAIALTTDTSLLTAIANDFGFERRVRPAGRGPRTPRATSCSGSRRAAAPRTSCARSRTAREQGLRTIALTGASGGRLAPLADIAITVPSEVTSHIQEAHIAVGQLIAFLVEDELFPS